MAIEINIDRVIRKPGGGVKIEPGKATILTEPGEISLARWDGFFQILDDCPQWFKDFHNAATEEEKHELKDGWNAAQHAEAYTHFARLVEPFCKDAGLDEILGMPLDQAEGPAVNSLFSVFLHVINAVYGYEPKEREFFTWQGKKFKCFKSPSVSGQQIPGANMTARDAINALQLEHEWRKVEGRNIYDINVGVLACLSREVLPDGSIEIPPAEIVAFAEWFEQRKLFFKGVTMDIALDVVFFSIHLKALSSLTPLSVACLLQPRPGG
jgi:hypothetical protein